MARPTLHAPDRCPENRHSRPHLGPRRPLPIPKTREQPLPSVSVIPATNNFHRRGNGACLWRDMRTPSIFVDHTDQFIDCLTTLEDLIE
jgi:hypothetical protein